MILDPLTLMKCSSGVVYITAENGENCEIVFNLRMDTVLKNNPELIQLDSSEAARSIEQHLYDQFDQCGLKRVIHKDHNKGRGTSQTYSGLWSLGYGILISFQFETKKDLYKFKLKHAQVYHHFMKSCTHYIHTEDE